MYYSKSSEGPHAHEKRNRCATKEETHLTPQLLFLSASGKLWFANDQPPSRTPLHSPSAQAGMSSRASSGNPAGPPGRPATRRLPTELSELAQSCWQVIRPAGTRPGLQVLSRAAGAHGTPATLNVSMRRSAHVDRKGTYIIDVRTH